MFLKFFVCKKIYFSAKSSITFDSLVFGDDCLDRNFLNLHRHLVCLGEKFHQLSAEQLIQQATTNYGSFQSNYMNDAQFQQALSEKFADLYQYHSAYFRSNFVSQMQQQQQMLQQSNLQQQQLINVESKQMQPSTSSGMSNETFDPNDTNSTSSPIPCTTLSDNEDCDDESISNQTESNDTYALDKSEEGKKWPKCLNF